MKKLLYTPDYIEKITQLRNALDQKYGKKTRIKVLSEIDHHIQHLKTFQHLGISIREQYGIDCEYYYIYAEHNFVFYQVEETCVKIINIYNEREDYIIKFLGSISKLHERPV